MRHSNRTLTIKQLVIFCIALLFALSLPATVFAETQAIEPRTRSCLLVDRSGSIKDRNEVIEVLSNMDTSKFDFVGYFDDQQISLDPGYRGGGDSSICEAVDEVAKLGYTHITVVTDGQQWPADYDTLSVYSDLELTIKLVGNKAEDAQELVDELSTRMVNSSLKVVKPDGTEKTIMDDYTPEVYELEIPEESQPEDNSDDRVTIIDEHGKCYWWVALILSVLVAALFDFIHELITRRRTTGETGIVAPKPIPKKAVHAIEHGAGVLADFSGSMAKQQRLTRRACKKAKTSKPVICFGDSVTEVEARDMARVKASGKTPGWEALELAAAKGWDELVVVSDLGFNGKSFEPSSFGKRFRKINAVVPGGYNRSVLADLQKIAEEVEVLPL